MTILDLFWSLFVLAAIAAGLAWVSWRRGK